MNGTFCARATSRKAVRSDVRANTASTTTEMALCKKLTCALRQDFVDLLGDLRLVGVRRQPIGLAGLKQLFAGDIRAQHHGTGLRFDHSGESARHDRLSGTGQPADGDQFRRPRMNQLQRKCEIGTRRPGNRCLVVAVLRDPIEAHLGADCGAHRHQQGECSECIAVFGGRPRQVSVQKLICHGLMLVMEKLHNRERQIIKNIDRRHRRVELDCIEQDRLAIDQDDVAQMQIVMTMTDESCLPRISNRLRIRRKADRLAASS